MLDYEGLLELAQKRRSIRNFKPQDVPDELINKILEVARWAPSGANSQPWEFVVVKDKAVRDRVVKITYEGLRLVQKLELTREKDTQHPNVERQPEDFGFKDAPVLIIVVGDHRTRAASALVAQQGPHSYLSGMANAFLYMHLAATTLGLGSQWLSATSQPLCQALLKQELGIPQGFDVYDMFCLGYPAQTPKPRKARELASMVHHNHYDMSKYRSDAEVRKFAREMQLGR